MTIFVDADACPVKDEAVRVAERHKLAIVMVANSWMRLPQSPLLQRVVVEGGPDAADDWIAERAQRGDVVVTQDILLAARCLKAGARVTSPFGKAFEAANIGMAIAMRDLNRDLREAGAIKGSNPVFSRRDRSQFLETMESLLQAIRRNP